MRHPLRLIPVLLGALAAPALASAAPASTYATLAALEARVAAIGFRLTTANASWCPVQQPQFGWIWGDLRLYAPKDQPAARAAYAAGDNGAAFLAAIAPGSPAARAGLTVGIPITAVNGTLPSGEGDHPYARVTAYEMLFASLPLGDPVAVETGAGSAPLTPVAGCLSDFRVEAVDRPMGMAEGRLVLISKGLAEFAKNDDELAAAVAHELAHNILRHRVRLDAAGVDRGLGKQFGRSARLFKQTEVEADRLSAWLLAGAGYDPAAAVRFWTAFGQRKGRPLFQAGTHPKWRDRVASIEEEIRAIDAARTAGRPLEPPLIANPPPLE